MTDLSEFSSFFDDDSIKLPPIKSKSFPNGKVYTVPSPSFETGVLLQQLANIATRLANGIKVPEEEAKRLRFDDTEEKDFSAMVLGHELLDEMKADGVPWGPIRKVTQYAFTHYAMNPESAERLLAPKAPKPVNRTAKRKKK